MMATTESTERHGKIIFADETYLIRAAVFWFHSFKKLLFVLYADFLKMAIYNQTPFFGYLNEILIYPNPLPYYKLTPKAASCDTSGKWG
ncbi:MAG: hypothetical protein GXY81_05270 [Candidatus Cloacimonetes bacterium]|nr:hypothetical protein [Candidatus Cloacimonadota bacterium]